MVETDILPDGLKQAIESQFEWLLVKRDGRSFPINADEIEVAVAGGRHHFSFIDDRGFNVWRINDARIGDDEIVLDVAGAFGRNRQDIRLVKRAQASQLSAELQLARLEKANEMAEILRAGLQGARVTRISLAPDNGRFAHIFFKGPDGKPSAAIADVSATASTETTLTTALLWQRVLSMRKRDPIFEVTMLAETKTAKPLRKLHALLDAGTRKTLNIGEVVRKNGKPELLMLPARPMSELWRERPKKLSLPNSPFPSVSSRLISELSPEHVDVLYSRQGETLRYSGLPFARVRTISAAERTWFGIGPKRTELGDSTRQAFLDLMEELRTMRRAASENKRHELYKTAPEAWLESILRSDITRLDANLILSPIYNQFRISNDKIDLLALRKDGRLVIIELKTTPDREMVFQAADYWRKIELQRRSGQLRAIRAFGDAEIIDKPALVYLVAPALSFHREVDRFMEMISPEIEIWRFELHEAWRNEIKVIARRGRSS
jgi:hypothetical protein